MSDMQKLGDAFDRHLQEVLANGREIMNKDGETVRVQATAADLNVIRQRLKDCGITAIPTEENPIGSIITEMQQRGLRLDVPDMPDHQVG